MCLDSFTTAQGEGLGGVCHEGGGIVIRLNVRRCGWGLFHSAENLSIEGRGHDVPHLALSALPVPPLPFHHSTLDLVIHRDHQCHSFRLLYKDMRYHLTSDNDNRFHS